jgi:hypothetical protein
MMLMMMMMTTWSQQLNKELVDDWYMYVIDEKIEYGIIEAMFSIGIHNKLNLIINQYRLKAIKGRKILFQSINILMNESLLLWQKNLPNEWALVFLLTCFLVTILYGIQQLFFFSFSFSNYQINYIIFSHAVNHKLIWLWQTKENTERS